MRVRLMTRPAPCVARRSSSKQTNPTSAVTSGSCRIFVHRRLCSVGKNSDTGNNTCKNNDVGLIMPYQEQEWMIARHLEAGLWRRLHATAKQTPTSDSRCSCSNFINLDHCLVDDLT